VRSHIVLTPQGGVSATAARQASVAQTPGFGVCGSSLDSRSRIRGQTTVFGIRSFSYRRAADLKGGGLRYAHSLLSRC
jgi:hypothetical protein